MNVMNVDKRSVKVHTLSHISEFIVERNPSNVMNVKRPSGSVHALPNTRDSTVERNPMNAVNVGNPSVGAQLFLNTRDCILERNLNVKKPALLTWILSNNREFIGQKNLINVLSVEKLSGEVQI